MRRLKSLSLIAFLLAQSYNKMQPNLSLLCIMISFEWAISSFVRFHCFKVSHFFYHLQPWSGLGTHKWSPLRSNSEGCLQASNFFIFRIQWLFDSNDLAPQSSLAGDRLFEISWSWKHNWQTARPSPTNSFWRLDCCCNFKTHTTADHLVCGQAEMWRLLVAVAFIMERLSLWLYMREYLASLNETHSSRHW